MSKKKRKKVPQKNKRGTLFEIGVQLALSDHSAGIEYDKEEGAWYLVSKHEVNLTQLFEDLFG